MIEYPNQGGENMVGKLLRKEERNAFCQEVGIENDIVVILLMIDAKKAKYFDGKNYYDVDYDIAKKYVNA